MKKIFFACAVFAILCDVQNHKSYADQNYEKSRPEKSLKNYFAQYILGPGDSLLIDILDIPEYSGVYAIGPDGTLYLPRLKAIYVEGLTVNELNSFLTREFGKYVKEPQIFISPVSYRPVRVYVGGEVARPGYYYLTGEQRLINENFEVSSTGNTLQTTNLKPSILNVGGNSQAESLSIGGMSSINSFRVPTVFDAVRSAGGITVFSELKKVKVIRDQPISEGGGKIQTSLDFLSFIIDGNKTQNIRLFDGDSIIVSRSDVELREQIIKASQTNLSPSSTRVFVTGRVRAPGAVELPQGASLDQAIAAAGGVKVIRGNIEFIRFNKDGSSDKRSFYLSDVSKAGSYKNPVLMPGDIINVNDSILSSAFSVLNEITTPALGIYSIYSIFN